MEFVYPVKAIQNPEPCLSTEQIHQWKTQGYVLVNGLIPDDLARKCAQEAKQAFEKHDIKDFGSNGKLYYG